VTSTVPAASLQWIVQAPEPAKPEMITRALDSADEADDPVFVASLRGGDHAAFEQLVRQSADRMLAVARRFLPEESDAQDAVQDAFISAFRGLSKFDGGSKLSTWLHRIVVNACLMKLRTRRRRPEVRMDDLMPRFGNEGHHESMPVQWRDAPESGEERRETLAMIRELILELPEDFRDVILLRDIEQLDTRAAAEMLGLTPSAVKTRLHRARMALRTLLDERMARQSKVTAAFEGSGRAKPQTRAAKVRTDEGSDDGSKGQKR
jgi:RNA polymerase sigma-70 factor (ECF subfamily)